jgi:hypothetical protein
MPGGYTIDEAHQLVLTCGWAEVTGEQALWHLRTLAADDRFAPDLRQIIDLRRVTDFDLTCAAVERLAELSPFGCGARRAFVVSTPVIYGLARMFENLRARRGDTFLVSRDMDEVLDWLDLADARADVLASLSTIPDMTPEWSARAAAAGAA